jgi:methylenetetrahydrofolate dehydrogenase (NADP+)/methenyltetrahydrofolate cyclohydrolase
MEQAVLSKKIIDGKQVAKEVREELKEEVLAATTKYGRKPGLAVVLIGDNPASHTYVKNKVTACKNVGIESFLLQYDKDTDEKTVVDIVQKLNADPLVDGILVQLPLPKHLPTQEILALIDPTKDVDGLTAINLGRLARGDDGLFPCTPLGIMRLLAYYKVPIKGKKIVVLGRSHLVGKPVALMLLSQDATVTICHSKTDNLPDVCRQADVLVAACGQPEMVKGDWVKAGAVVIDVGTTRVENADGSSALKGDVQFEPAFENASLITPVPGGVGPMTIAMLLVNTCKSFKMRMAALQK